KIMPQPLWKTTGFQSLPSNRPIRLVPQIRFVTVKTTSSSLRDSSSYNHLQLELSRTCAITKVRHQLETAKQTYSQEPSSSSNKDGVVDFILAACPYK
ncbi:hypothetical protein TVAGG3_0571890, partial [Trichomonas vaginalis G3]|uniref:hypothetical protein n=1 Tax=Trichomonas vaginalis (strain ATCC PRA-98 / G3) TaxID=412133 RepID=UPI0021E58F8F